MAEYQDGMKLFDTDMDAVSLGIQGIGVLSGCVCSATGADITVSWTAGIAKTRSALRSVAASSVSLASLQNASYPCKVLIYVDDTDGNVKAVAGAAQAAYPVGNVGRSTWQPAPPDFSGSYAITYDDVVLAEVWLSKIGAVIATVDVTDRRVFVSGREGSYGSSTITAGNTYIDVAHGLAITPVLSNIRLSPQDSLLGRAVYPSNVGATTFRINLTSLDTIDHVVNWEAEI